MKLKHHDKIAFITCTSLALAIVVGMWIWSVQSVVRSGVAGTKELLSDVGETASSAREEIQPDSESVQAVKDGLKELMKPTEVAVEQRQEVVEAVAEKMKEKLEESNEPQESDESKVVE